jgi:hypothetical protein
LLSAANHNAKHPHLAAKLRKSKSQQQKEQDADTDTNLLSASVDICSIFCKQLYALLLPESCLMNRCPSCPVVSSFIAGAAFVSQKKRNFNAPTFV